MAVPTNLTVAFENPSIRIALSLFSAMYLPKSNSPFYYYYNLLLLLDTRKWEGGEKAFQKGNKKRLCFL
jgi:hypothetical protein